MFYGSTNARVEERETRHQALVRNAAGECMVLLKNDKALPIEEKGKIALYGSGARHTIKGGTGSGDVNSRNTVSIEQGFLNAGFEIATKAWLDKQDDVFAKARHDYDTWAKAESESTGLPETAFILGKPFKEPEPALVEDEDLCQNEAKYAVYVISRNSGEGTDRFYKEGDYLLFPHELSSIEKIAKTYEKTVVILNIGGVMDLTRLNSIPGVDALLLMTQLGSDGGDALLDVLTGAVTPSGKTTNTWPKDYWDIPSSKDFSHNGSIHDEMYTDGIYVGYRYFDTFKKEVEYCFGYGLSYTSFEIKAESIETLADIVTLDVNVKNTGKTYAGREVVQLYVSPPTGTIDKPLKTLAAFKKTSLLLPGECEDIKLTFSIRDVASYSEEKAGWVLEAGDYLVLVGNSSDAAGVVAKVKLDRDVLTLKTKNLFNLDTDLNEIKLAARPELTLPKRVLKATIDSSKILTKVVRYQDKREEIKGEKSGKLTLKDVFDGKCTIEELVATLSVEEMATLCVGSFAKGSVSALGDASVSVPGAAGETVALKNQAIKSLILADGPAGLRLIPHFLVTKDGAVITGGSGLGGDNEDFPKDLDRTNTKEYYQYCTAIPIGWALAQSWNEEMVTELGNMIGYEMEQFHVDLWLAPAMNIHRNPLCGRNFEYYSEDPLLAGKMASAMTKGVQKHKGKGSTIKHFAANNQEDNRMFLNAHISERTLREIYLKSFEIAVKESQPLSIMTSYNLINGIHSACNKDLIQHMARDEWGFKGFVMTDWLTSQDIGAVFGDFGERHYPISASTGCIYAGNDVQMPGCQKNVDDIVEGAKSGNEIDGFKITLADLQFCTANLLRVVSECIQTG